MCSAGVSLGNTPLVSRMDESLRRTDARVASLADCFPATVRASSDLAGTCNELTSRRTTARFNLAKIYSPTCYCFASMILKVDWISTVGRRVAATLQYFISDNSIACATAFGDRPVPVRM